ncbi:hypothetical protein QMO56_25630 [Roseomonas sp. E05]|uniref:hypothetical protein n=1 Tax=Roseomonas sp. E05 TaxID=3046310 RepID=UPI0024BA6602|nr:hypothetical protein [Roseomonas sp. E05]MDJ0391488.1 hypothetical protein [Roseomonas sp. E05]
MTEAIAGPSDANQSRGFEPRDFTRENPEGEPTVSVSGAELAARLRLSERAIRDLAKREIVVKLSHGAYDLWASIGRYAEHMREAAAARGEHSAGSELTRERIRETKERADHLALKNGQLTADLVEAVKVEREWSDILRGVRGRMLGVPGRCQQRLGHLTPHDVATIDREIRDALAEAGNDDA